MTTRIFFLICFLSTSNIYCQELEGNWYSCAINGEYVEYNFYDSSLLIQTNNDQFKIRYTTSGDTIFYRYNYSTFINGIYLVQLIDNSKLILSDYYLSNFNTYEFNALDTLIKVTEFVDSDYDERKIQANCLDIRTSEQKKNDSLQIIRIQQLEERLEELKKMEKDTLNRE